MTDVAQSFLQACVDGDIDQARLLASNPNLNIYKCRWKLIRSVCESNQTELFKWLIKTFKCFNVKKYGPLIMKIAYKFHRPEIMYFMTKQYEFGENILESIFIYSICNSNIKLCRKIINSNISIKYYSIKNLCSHADMMKVDKITYVKLLFDNFPELQSQISPAHIKLAIEIDLEMTKYLVSFAPKYELELLDDFLYTACKNDKLDIAQWLKQTLHFELLDDRVIRRCFMAAAENLNLEMIKWLCTLNLPDSNIIHNCFERIGQCSKNCNVDKIVEMIDFFEEMGESYSSHSLVLQFYKKNNLAVAETLETKFALDHESIDNIRARAIKHALDNGKIDFASVLLEKYPGIDFDMEGCYCAAIQDNNCAVLEYLHASTYYKDMRLDGWDFERTVRQGCFKASDKSIEWLYNNVPGFAVGSDIFAKLCAQCITPIIKTSNIQYRFRCKKRTAHLRIIAIIQQHDDNLDSVIVDDTVQSYTTRNYKNSLEDLANGNYASALKRLGIVERDYKLKCCVCDMTHDNIIQMPCYHFACLESLLKLYQKESDDDYCPVCKKSFEWGECVSITANFNGMKTKSAMSHI